jgi:hypothetical protein
LDEAVDAYGAAIRFKPDYAQAHSNLGNALRELGQLDEAIVQYNNAIRIKPDYANAHFNLGYALLLRGDLSAGFAAYEWRKSKTDPSGNRSYPKPLWSGTELLSGKTILLHHEQGLGDTIQMCRYAPLLAARGAKVLLAPQKMLQQLLGTLDKAVRIVDADDPSLEFDYHLPIMSLPYAFRTTLETIPNRIPYLQAPAELSARWSERLGRDGFKIAICWQGSLGKVDRGRSFHVREFLPLSKLPGVRLISVHKGAGEAQLKDLPEGLRVETLGKDFASGLHGFLDTAAVISCCDLVISCDTAVAHLAGALGVTTWIAVKKISEWRWLMSRPDSPWYPTARVFRQQVDGDWAGVFREMETALALTLSGSGRQRVS